MPSKILEKLAALDRPETPITISSLDGKQEVKLVYVRPTLAKDQVLQKALQEEYDSVLAGLKATDPESGSSIYSRLLEQYIELGKENATNYLVQPQLWKIRQDTLTELELVPVDDLKKDATEEEKAAHKEAEEAFIGVFKPAFEARYEKVRALLSEQNSIEELAHKCATLQIETRARERAIEVHRRNLVADSLWYREQDGDPLQRAFANADEVAEYCAASTIVSLANKISEELEKQRNLPFTSAGKS